jgi:TolB-like protein/Tfp pilus assembly protein PilF
MIMGTVAYMSPEQARALAVDQRSDIWSVGVVLYEMIAGRLPFEGATTLDVLSAILNREPDLVVHYTPEVPRELEHILSKALRKEREERYQTAKDLLIDLKDLKRELELQAQLERSAPPELRGRPGTTRDSEAGSPETIQTQSLPTAGGGRAPGIAVLPFANLSADKENEYFSDGLAEEIINALAHMPNLKVAGRTSSFYFRGKDVEFEEIGRRLKVDHILEGSVRKAANRIRVTAQLIKVTDGFHLWSERYDREITDVFAIQDEITQAIAEALRVKLSPQRVVRRRYEPNLLAYDAYLKARQQWFKGTAESQAQFKEFVDLAIELDPKFALPHFLLGGQYSMVANLGISPARKVIPLGRAAEQEALRLDPSLPEPHAMLACFAGYEFDWDEARRQWQLAMAREPASLSAVKPSDIRFWYGNHYLVPIGRPAEAIEAETGGIQEDPLNLLYRYLYAGALQNAGKLGDAEAELRKILEVDESFSVALGTLGAVCAQQGRMEEALAFTEKAHALMPWQNPIVGQLAALLVHTRATTRAQGLIDRLRASNTYLGPTGLTVFHAMCGEFDRAAEWAEKAIEEQYGPLIRILAPLLKHTPVWPALAKRMNLPPPGGSSAQLH